MQKLCENNQQLHCGNQQFESCNPVDFVFTAPDNASDTNNEEIKYEESVAETVKPPWSLSDNWLRKLERKRSKTTVKNYLGWVNRYEKWLGKREANQDTIESFIEELNAKGNNTKVAVAALKSKYEIGMKMKLDLKGLAEESKNKKPHVPVSQNVRQSLEDLFIKPRDLRWKIACRLLYDLGSRA